MGPFFKNVHDVGFISSILSVMFQIFARPPSVYPATFKSRSFWVGWEGLRFPFTERILVGIEKSTLG